MTVKATTATATVGAATPRKTILVTGGAGFIGSNLCIHLLSQSPNNHVICVDKFQYSRW